jgi:TIR domain
MAHDVFVSHSAKDKTTADAVCAALEAKGFRCWIAPRDILPGREWGASIVEAIKSSRVMVLIFSGHANQSPQINREVERAVNWRIPIIPMRIEDVVPTEALEYFLSSPHWLDAFTPPLERHLEYLAKVIGQILQTPPTVAGADLSSGIRPRPQPTVTPSGIRGKRPVLVWVISISSILFIGFLLVFATAFIFRNVIGHSEEPGNYTASDLFIFSVMDMVFAAIVAGAIFLMFLRKQAFPCFVAACCLALLVPICLSALGWRGASNINFSTTDGTKDILQPTSFAFIFGIIATVYSKRLLSKRVLT